MVLNAYASFFAVTLVGSLVLLDALIRTHARQIRAALRREIVEAPIEPSRPRLTRVRAGRRLALPPIVFSICRI